MTKRATRTKTGIVLLDPRKLVPAKPHRDPGDLSELRVSIDQTGLLQPIIVAPDRKTVVAGRRRLAVVRSLGWTKVECVVRGDGTKADQLLIALTENLQRKDLSDAERAANIAQLDEEMRRLHGEHPKGGRPRTGHVVTGSWSLEKTANALSISKALVSKALRVNEAVTKHPELAKIEGMQVILRDAARLDALAKAPKGARDAGFVLGDARRAIASLEDRSVQLLLTDPPYGVKAKSSSKDPRRSFGIEGDESPEVAAKLLEGVLAAMAPKLTKDAHCFIFTTLGESYLHLVPVIDQFFDIRSNIVWVKANSGVGSAWFAPTTEVIVFGTVKPARGRARKPKDGPIRPLLGKRLPNVAVRAPVPADKAIHQTEKPVELLATLITKSTVPGELVADPFAGSASGLRAAKQTGRAYWGVELDKRNYSLALAELAKTKLVDTSLQDFADGDDGQGDVRPYAFVTDPEGVDHVVHQQWRKDLKYRPADADSKQRFGRRAAPPSGLEDQPAIPLAEGWQWVRYGLVEPVCSNIEGGEKIFSPSLDVCTDCARWLASYGHKDRLEFAVAGDRQPWITGMIAPTEFDRIVKPKEKKSPAKSTYRGFILTARTAPPGVECEARDESAGRRTPCHRAAVATITHMEARADVKRAADRVLPKHVCGVHVEQLRHADTSAVLGYFDAPAASARIVKLKAKPRRTTKPKAKKVA
jgi:DNA modification methylase